MAGLVDAQPVEVSGRLVFAVLLAVDGVGLELGGVELIAGNGLDGLVVADPVADPVYMFY